MNEIDELARFRDTVPVGVTPRAEWLPSSSPVIEMALKGRQTVLCSV